MKNSIFWGMLSVLLLFSCGNNKSHYEQIHESSGGVPSEGHVNNEAEALINSLLNEDDHQRSLFVVDSLEKTLRRTKFKNSRQVIEDLREEVEKHRNGVEPNDDLTMLCLRIDA